MFDSHIHSIHSPDGNHTVTALCEKAIEEGLQAIAITDHCEIDLFEPYHIKERLTQSLISIEKAQKDFSGKLLVTKGVEIAQMLFDTKLTEKIIKSADYDFILGSVHRVRGMMNISAMDFTAMSKQEINTVIRKYYEELFETAKKLDFDSLAHLTYPLRYINGIQKQNYTIACAIDIIEELFKFLIQRKKAIEVNLSGLNNNWGETMPYKDLIALYKQLGAVFITVGTDAHFVQHVGTHIKQAYQLLKECGFDSVTFYQNRKPSLYKI